MKLYGLRFGSGDPATNTGLTPTFTVFALQGLTAITAPGVTETPAGSGLYSFLYDPTLPIKFVVDGGAVLSASDRYIVGLLDPLQIVDERLGISNDSVGSTNLASVSSIFGFLSRVVGWLEGNAIFTKSNATWQVYSKGSSTLLMQKTLTNDTTQSTKTDS